MRETEYVFRPVQGPLSDCVDGFWHLRHAASGQVERIAPDGQCEIILHRAQPPIERREGQSRRQPEAFLYGPLNRVLLLEQTGEMDVIGIRLQPWASGALGVDPSAWRNRAVALQEVAGSAAGRLLELARASCDLEQFSELAEPLLMEMFEPPAAQPVVKACLEALERGTATTVEDFARQQSCTSRTIGRHFKRACGLTAGDCLQIQRFLCARAALKQGRESLAGIAEACGYADQAHMTRAFRRFAGESPVPARRPARLDPLYDA